MTTKRLHYISGLVITAFIALHLFNHFFSLAGAERHIAMMNRLRPIYRQPVIEAILLGTVLIQIISGISLFKKARKTAAAPFEKLHIWSGLYLAFFLLIHVGAVLGGRAVLHLDTNFYFGVAGLNTFPFNLFFVPYYGLAIMAFFGHLASVHSKKSKRDLIALTVNRQASVILLIGFIITVVLLYGLTNHFKGVALPEEYKVLVGK